LPVLTSSGGGTESSKLNTGRVVGVATVEVVADLVVVGRGRTVAVGAVLDGEIAPGVPAPLQAATSPIDAPTNATRPTYARFPTSAR
jgi:hypothetical protein